MSTFYLKIYEAEGRFFEGEADYLSIPAPDGELAFMAGHEPLVCAIKEGLLSYRPAGSTDFKYAAVSGGMVRFEHNEALVLSESVEDTEEIDEIRAKRSLEEAMEEMRFKKSRIEFQVAEAKMRRALNRLDVKKRKNGR